MALCSETFPIWQESDAQQHLHPSSHPCSMFFLKMSIIIQFYLKGHDNFERSWTQWTSMKFLPMFFFSSCAQIRTCSGSRFVISIARMPQNEIKIYLILHKNAIRSKNKIIIIMGQYYSVFCVFRLLSVDSCIPAAGVGLSDSWRLSPSFPHQLHALSDHFPSHPSSTAVGVEGLDLPHFSSFTLL